MIICDYIDDNVKNYLNKNRSSRTILTFYKEPFDNYRGNKIIFIDDVLNKEDCAKIDENVEKTVKIIDDIFSKYLKIQEYNLYDYHHYLQKKSILAKLFKYKYSIDKIMKNKKIIYLNFFSSESILFEWIKNEYSIIKNYKKNYIKIIGTRSKIKNYIEYKIKNYIKNHLFMNCIFDYIFIKTIDKNYKKLKNIVLMDNCSTYSQLINELERGNNIFLLQNDINNKLRFLKKNYKFYSLKIKDYKKFKTNWNNIKCLYRKGLFEIASMFNVKIELVEFIIGFNLNMLKDCFLCLTILEDNKCEIDLLYVEQSVYGIQALGTDFFNRNKFHSIEVLHGVPCVVEVGKTSKVAVYGQRDKLFLSSHGVDKTKIIITGNPYYDKIFNLIKEKQYNFLLLILDWMPFFPSSNSYEKIFTQVIDMIKLLQYFRNENLIIKLHPAQSEKEVEYISHLVNNFKEVRNRIKIKKNEDTINLLRDSKIIYTYSSSVGVEALLMKKPLIILDYIYYNHRRSIDYEKYGGCFVARNFEELLLATEDIIKDIHGYLKKNNENIEQTRQYFSGNLKGESYKNVARAINEMLYK